MSLTAAECWIYAQTSGLDVDATMTVGATSIALTSPLVFTDALAAIGAHAIRRDGCGDLVDREPGLGREDLGDLRCEHRRRHHHVRRRAVGDDLALDFRIRKRQGDVDRVPHRSAVGKVHDFGAQRSQYERCTWLHVVGVDGSTQSRRAVEWAADHAALERRPLVLLHASPVTGPVSGMWLDQAGIDHVQLREAIRVEARAHLLAALQETCSTVLGGWDALRPVDVDYDAYLRYVGKANEVNTQRQLNSWGNITGAAKGFFKEGSRGYEALTKAEQAFRLFEMAMSVRAMGQKLFESQAVTGARLAADATGLFFDKTLDTEIGRAHV